MHVSSWIIRSMRLCARGIKTVRMRAGKLDLYVAAAGFHPARCLPVVLDVGTANKGLRADPLYMGLDQDRIAGDEYYEVAFITLKKGGGKPLKNPVATVCPWQAVVDQSTTACRPSVLD